MIVRIPIDDENSRVKFTDPVITGNDHSGDGEGGDSGEDGGDEAFSLPKVGVELRSRIPDRYASHRSEYPVTLINITVPEDDLPIVAGWFSNGAGTGGVASETLLKRATSAVIGTLKDFYTECDRNGIFTRPFKLGYALRLANGRHSYHGEIVTLFPSAEVPQMPVTSRSLSGNVLQTVTQLRLLPGSLRVSMEPFDLPASHAEKVTHLDFYATRPADTLSGDETVKGIGSFNIGDEHLFGWIYNGLPAATIADTVKADKNFRIIASVAIEDASRGFSGLELPRENKNLQNWTEFEVLKSDTQDDGSEGGDSGEESDPDTPPIIYKSKRVTVGPLHMGYPELRKKMRGLSVRGIFLHRLPGVASPEEGQQEITVTLYGAHHRSYWHRVASTTGGNLRLLRGVAYRWWQVEIRAGANDEINEIHFELR